jgi:hypothetical protein
VDGVRFDGLARALAASRTRRGALGALAGAAFGALGLDAASARTCRSVGNACSANGDCCSGNCAGEGRSRKLCQCLSPADCPAPAPCFTAVCAGGGCQTAPLPDQTDCSGGVCFNQTCCAPDSDNVTCANACGSQVNNCGQPVLCPPCCTPADGTCQTNDACCSGVCVEGICLGGPVAVGAACDDDGDCLNQHCCSGFCRDLDTDPDNCGACGTVCSNNNMATRTCSGGACTGTCAAGYGDCNDDRQTDGCETLVSGNVANCNDCGVACRPDQICAVDGCACAPGDSICTGICVDLQTDENNCGACGTICRIGETCAAGVCQCGSNPRCAAHEVCSDDVCVDRCLPWDGFETGSEKCQVDCDGQPSLCNAGPESAWCNAGYGTVTDTPCDRNADCASGLCVARLYGSSVGDVASDGSGRCIGIVGYICPEGGSGV